ncbi:hypothetical protein BE20_07950 [Sorangium cellulosum]|nr:hypothetical protein BE20_07950 [Sorangium cellulosum]
MGGRHLPPIIKVLPGPMSAAHSAELGPQSAGIVGWVQQLGRASQTFATQPLQVVSRAPPVSHGSWAHAPCAGCSQY